MSSVVCLLAFAECSHDSRNFLARLCGELMFDWLKRRRARSLTPPTQGRGDTSPDGGAEDGANRANGAGAAAAISAREVRAVQRRFPELAECCEGLSLEPDQHRLAMFDLVSRCWPGAAEAALRTRLKAFETPAARRLIAESDIREGIPYSSNVRLFPDLWEKAMPAILAHEEAYGGALFSVQWPSLSRGRALRYYFEHHPPVGRVLHVAPEAELQAWFRAGGFAYETLGVGPQNDLAEDLTALPLDDGVYDMVICHRVLEHVFDEAAALSEVLRILRPGGCFNVSVPESMHLPSTLEWNYPDASHHNHFRQYGADFADRLAVAGFKVGVEDWLLQQSKEQLQAAGTCPFRFYNAVRR
jgi:hypothetical protein